MTEKSGVFIYGLAAFLLLSNIAFAQAEHKGPKTKDIILATTTSTQDSGLLDVLVPMFEKQTGYVVKTIAVGTGHALAMGEQGEADVLLCHAPEAEKRLVDNGDVINYYLVMHNDFVIAGPPNDPAKIKGQPSPEAFKVMADKGEVFVSRGDDSGTHKKEKSLWKQTGKTPSTKDDKWYLESGQGMGATLLLASEKAGYTLTDRATYLAQRANINLEIVSEGDQSLLNIYHVMQVNPKKFDKVNGEGGKAFAEFMVAQETQQAIAAFGKEKFGQSLFFPDAGK
jgi:tungstate transport system substrate-binding protein